MSRSYFALQDGLLSLLLLLVVVVAVRSEECDRFSMCKGPIRYYEDLNCKPVYEKPGDCCAVSYDCSHLNNRSLDKCYVNGHEYAVNETLRDEDKSSPCDLHCTCIIGAKSTAEFRCVVVDCPNQVFRQLEEGCSIRYGADDCCGEKICSKDETTTVKCEVDGKNYTSGEKFYPLKDPNLSCVCQEGYKGENVAPFCKKLGCGTELRRSEEVRSFCAPVFYDSQVPQASCSYAYRCQNDNDAVIKTETGKAESHPKISEETSCKFGNMTMHIGDQLNQATNEDSVCVKCVCEVPPIPTCQRLPDSDCEDTKHLKFN